MAWTRLPFENIGYSENDIQELVSKGLAKVED